MKKKSALILGPVLLFLLSISTVTVWGKNTEELSRLTTVCESKVGGILFGVNDGFSNLKFCPKNTRKVLIGEEQNTSVGENLIVPKSGNIAFVGGSIALMKNGTVWMYNVNTSLWDKADFNGDGKGDYDITETGISYENIIQWYSGGNLSFLTNKGEYWLYNDAISRWVKASELVL